MTPRDPGAAVTLWWLPVGAGGTVVTHTSGWWESIVAHRERREPQPLFHAALEVILDGQRHVIEMTPVVGAPRGPRGVVATGPVGAVPLGLSAMFRYEVRRWRDGMLPDRNFAVGGPVAIDMDAAPARRLLASVPDVPRHTWGRRPRGSHDMWNSNSLISWLLEVGGVDASRLVPPGHGRAPGWRAGIDAARSLPRAGATPAR
ncbi:MAG: hypothetical protein ACK5IM_03945 [Demequina sp.]|uniref:hypothetical protein n=1 Tax=Demequina sp. TaxID=2050685 RepID=UPI003A89E90C